MPNTGMPIRGVSDPKNFKKTEGISAMAQLQTLDYSLIGKTSEEAVARGLASAAWYHSPIPHSMVLDIPIIGER